MEAETARQVEFIVSRQIMPESVVAGEIVDCSDPVHSGNQACGAMLVLDETWVNPYSANLALIGLLRAPEPYQERARLVVKNWLRWFVNATARRMAEQPELLPGTIPDFDCTRSGCTPTADYGDSVDSYAATFLSLLRAAYDTGDAGLRAFVVGALGGGVITGIAETLVLPYGGGGVRLPTGLTEALPDSEGLQYTMDNAEVYAGLRDFAALLDAVGDARASRYRAYADQTRAAMFAQLWDPDRRGWRVEAGDPGAPALGGSPAPAGIAQFWPALFGVYADPVPGRPDPLADHNITPWRAFDEAYGGWWVGPEFTHDGWANQSIAAAAKLFGTALGDTDEGRAYLDASEEYELNLDARFWTEVPDGVAPECAWKVRKTPCDEAYWSIDEAGWWLIAASDNPSMIPGS